VGFNAWQTFLHFMIIIISNRKENTKIIIVQALCMYNSEESHIYVQSNGSDRTDLTYKKNKHQPEISTKSSTKA
jgi:hypothetical protein